MNLNYTYLANQNEKELGPYIVLPKILFSDNFKGLSWNAKLLYAIMLDRTNLSQKNKWADEKGRVFIYFTVEKAKEFLACCKETAIKAINQLKEFGLIETIRNHIGQAYRIYVKKVQSDVKQNTPVETPQEEPPFMEDDWESLFSMAPEIIAAENESYQQSYQQVMESYPQVVGKVDHLTEKVDHLTEKVDHQVEKIDLNNTNINNTKIINPDINNPSMYIHPSSLSYKKTKSYGMDGEKLKQQKNEERNSLKAQIDYSNLTMENDSEKIDELVEMVVDIMTAPKDTTYRLKGQEKPVEIIRSVFRKLKAGHIREALKRLEAYDKPIENGKIIPFCRTMLYDIVVSSSLSHYYDKSNNNAEKKEVKPQVQRKNAFCNYEQRTDWNFEEMERLARERLRNS